MTVGACLNNCSYPNGQCVNGTCFCSMLYEPYNNSLEYFPFMGEDCSYLVPFAGSIQFFLNYPYILLILFFTLVLYI